VQTLTTTDVMVRAIGQMLWMTSSDESHAATLSPGSFASAPLIRSSTCGLAAATCRIADVHLRMARTADPADPQHCRRQKILDAAATAEASSPKEHLPRPPWPPDPKPRIANQPFIR
jgi:hypothetical protein